MITRNKLRIFKVVVASIIFWVGASSCAYRGRPIPERVVDTLQQRLAIQDVQFLFMGLRPRPTTQVHE